MTKGVPLQGLEQIGQGKVRDIYAVDEGHLLIVTSDRISAFDVVLPTAIPDKGKVLTALSAFWFGKLLKPGQHHLITTDTGMMPPAVRNNADILYGRSMLVRRTQVFPVECVVRGYLVGSGWKDYCSTGQVCGIELPTGMQDGDQLPEPIFTPASKATSGHDENISYERMEEIIGAEAAAELRSRTLDLYTQASAHARDCGIIIADTKLEFGRLPSGEIIVIDEVFTPDSSRFWPTDEYRPGQAQPSFDKQFVRDHLAATGWNREPPAPELPDNVVAGTRDRYLSAYRQLVGFDLRV